MAIVKYDTRQAAAIWARISEFENSIAHVWRQECISNRQFYEGEQYTSEEIEVLKERGQYDIVINKIRKAIKGMAGLVSSSIPKYKLVPVGKEDDTKATLGNQLLDWIWDNSGGLFTYKNAVKAALVDNIAYLHVICPQDKRIKFIKLGFDDVIVDPNSKHPMFDDAEMIIIRRYVPTDYVERVYGITDIVSEVPSEFYTIVPELLTTHANFLGKVFDAGRRYVNLYECYRKIPQQNGFDFKGKIVKETVIGYQHAYVEEMPEEISEYPIIPLYVEGYDNPYKRGEVHFLKAIQRFINKTYGVTLMNAQLMSNPKVFVRDRDIPRGDIDTFMNNYANPGSVNILTGDAQPPQTVGGQPLNNAFFSLYMDAKNEFEWLTIPNQVLGFGKQEGYNSDLLEVKEGAIESMKEFLSVVDMACSRLGLVCLQYVQAYADPNMIINIPDNKGRRKAVELNKQQGLDVDDEQSVQRFIKHQRSQGVDDEEIEYMIAKAKEDSDYIQELQYVINDTNFSEFDVRVIPGSYSPTFQIAMLRMMMELVNIGAVDPSMVLEYAPVENRQELKDRFDTIKQLRGELAAIQEENEELKRFAEDAKGRILTNEISTEKAKAKLKLDKLAMEAKVKNMRDKFQNQLMTREKMIELEQLIKEMIMDTKHRLFKEEMKQINESQGEEGETLEATVERILKGE